MKPLQNISKKKSNKIKKIEEIEVNYETSSKNLSRKTRNRGDRAKLKEQ